MKSTASIRVIIFTVIVVIIAGSLAAANAGSIKGTVTDYKTGEPIGGVAVQIDGTTMGAKSDFDGNFVILSVPPGTYSLNFTAMGYKKVQMTDVEVIADQTTERNIQLESSIIESDKVTVVCGTRKGIEFTKTGSTKIMTNKEIQVQSEPVATVDDLLKKQTAVTKDANGNIHVRGGRTGETCRIVDGVSFSDPLGFSPAHGGTNIVNDEAFDAMFFKGHGVNPFVDTEDDHLSTFASDVDDASFVLTRSYLDRNVLPPTEAVRTEEFINHFDYDYTAPHNRTFSVHIEGAPSKFGLNCYLLRIGLKGKVIPDELRKPANLIFVIDISGSMDRENRLGLVKRSLYELLDQLTEQDKVGIVVYGNVGRIVLEPTPVHFRHDIERKIDELQTDGATNAEEGITLGYDMAHRHFEEGKINRVILCSDGVANVGRSGPDAILELIKKYADEGITLSTIGFGMGNYNDVLMEKLGNKGNGMYAYVDDITEARRIFKDNLTGNLQVIARDVKIQVDFNPNIVRSYRLLGYENRDVADDKFRDDKEDGGEVGAGHTVTALYEVKFHNHYAQRFFGTVYIRYKDPETFAVTEFSENMTFDDFNRRFEDATPDFRLAAAAAEFAEILRKSYWAKDGSLEDVFNIVREIDREKDDNSISEFKDLIRKARSFENELSQK